MELNELVLLAQTLEEDRDQDIEQAKSFVYAHYYIFLKTGYIGVLNTAIGSLKSISTTMNTKDSSYDPLLRDIVVMRCRKTGTTLLHEDLEAAIFSAQELLAITDYLHLDRFKRCKALTDLLQMYAQSTGNTGPRDEMLQRVQQILDDAMHIIRSGTFLDNPDTVRKFKDAISFLPEENEVRDAMMKLIAVLKEGDGIQARDQGDLDEAIAIYKNLRSSESDEEDTTGRVSDTAIARLESIKGGMFDWRSLKAGIEPNEAVRVAESGVLMARANITLQRSLLLALSDALARRSSTENGSGDLRRAMRILERMLTKLDVTDELQSRLQSQFGSVISTALGVLPKEKAAHFKLLDRVVAVAMDSWSFACGRSSVRSDVEVITRRLTSIMELLSLRIKYRPNIQDVDLIIKLTEEAAGFRDKDFLDKVRFQAVFVKAKHTESLEDLDDVIRMGEKTLKDPNLGTNIDEVSQHRLFAMFAAFADRFRLTGDIEVINEAITRAEQAVRAVPVGSESKIVRLVDLSKLYRCRYDGLRDPQDIEKAVETGKQALDLNTPDNRRRCDVLLWVAQCFIDRFHVDPVRFLGDLDTATAYTEESKNLLSSVQEKQIYCYENLKQIYEAKHYLTKNQEDLNKAIFYVREAMQVDQEGSAIMLEASKFHLASLLFKKDPLSAKVLAEAVKHSQDVLAMDKASALSRIRCAKFAVRALGALGRLDEAADAAERAILLLPLPGSRAAKQQEQQSKLKEFGNVATHSVGMCFHGGRDASRCLELLEYSRGIINGLKYDYRMDISQLERECPQLARRFVNIRDKLDMPMTSASTALVDRSAPFTGPSPDGNWTPLQPEFGRKHNLSKEFNDLINDIRRLDGFASFMQSSEATKLALASRSPSEAVVVINTSPSRCDAIVIQKGKNIGHLHLKELHLEDIRQSVRVMRRVRASLASSRGSHCRKIGLVLAWLWRTTVGPILDLLGYTSEPANSGGKWPRVWWVPTGALTQLPLHAAGYHSPDHPGEPALDRVVSSYSSFVKALIYTRQNIERTISSIPQSPSAGKTILVSMSQTPDASSLPFADREVNDLDCLLSQSQNVSRLLKPTKAELTPLLASQCAVFHFAGHGMSNPTDPSESCLLLRDWKTNPLAVKDLIGLKLYEDPPWLAYLSACSTGESQDERLYDESIHLMGACQGAGFQHVIGSLWEVSDMHSSAVAKDVYQYLLDNSGFGSSGNVAMALHLAVRRLRDRTGAYRGKRSGEEDDWSVEDAEQVRFLLRDVGHTQEDHEDAVVRAATSVKVVSGSTTQGDPLIWAAYIHVGV